MRLPRSHSSDPELWASLSNAEARFFEARMDFMRSVVDLEGTLRRGLGTPHQRGTALRLLLILDEGIRRALFSALLPLAIEVHSDTRLSRDVIASIDGRWRGRKLHQQLPDLLDSGGPEEYRGAAELLRQLDSSLLDWVLARAAGHIDPEVREVAVDFGYTRIGGHRVSALDSLSRAPGSPTQVVTAHMPVPPGEREPLVLELVQQGLSIAKISEALRLSRDEVEGIVLRLLETAR